MACSKLGWLVSVVVATSACDDGSDKDAGAQLGQGAGSQIGGVGGGDGGACDEEHAQRSCGGGGMQFCEAPGYDEPLEWTRCVVNPACTPGEELPCESSDFEDEELTDYCVVEDGIPMPNCDVDELCGCYTPLVLSFDGAEPRMQTASAAFDLDVAGGCLATDWPESRTPWLAMDRDGDGAIADGRELFGSGTRMKDGTRAPHGFAALAELDDDGNGVIDARDAGFAKLLIWSDGDLDKRGTASELEGAGGRLIALDLRWHADRVCDARGNCGVERATFTWKDRDGALRQGTIVDVHLACQ